jgi:hypothetical protein
MSLFEKYYYNKGKNLSLESLIVSLEIQIYLRNKGERFRIQVMKSDYDALTPPKPNYHLI